MLLGAGCRNVEPAPEDLDGLAHWYLDTFWEAEASAVIEATQQYDAAAGGRVAASDGAWERGSLTDLTPDEILPLDFDGDAPDPALAAGFYLLDAFDCTLPALDDVLIALNQDELYEGWYEAYDRTYTTDEAVYLSGETDLVRWHIDIENKLLNTPFDERLHGALRYHQAESGEAAIVQLTWMPTPAVFEQGDKVFAQDYQIEVYYEASPGRVSHLYGLWREVQAAGFTAESDAFVNTVLNNLEDWDETTGQLCRGELPE